jgi:hypothetical protein
MTTMRLLGALLTSVVLTAGIGFGSRAAYRPRYEHESLLRLSWRMRTKSLRACRQRTAAELAALPAHMRALEVCTTHHLSYRLVVEIDEGRADTIEVATAGAKGDRPLFVLHDVPLTPGRHWVEIEFAPADPALAAHGTTLSYHGRVEARRGRIELITLAPDGNSLTEGR